MKTFYNLQEQNIAMKKTQQNLELEVKGRRESQVTMKSQIDHFHLMLESLPQIAFTLNEDGIVDFVNGKWYQYSDAEQNFLKHILMITTSGKNWRDAEKRKSPGIRNKN